MGESLGYRWLDRHGRGHEDLLRPDGSIVCTLTADRHRNGDTDLQPVPEELNKLASLARRLALDITEWTEWSGDDASTKNGRRISRELVAEAERLLGPMKDWEEGKDEK